jgi:hypothetical protein
MHVVRVPWQAWCHLAAGRDMWHAKMAYSHCCFLLADARPQGVATARQLPAAQAAATPPPTPPPRSRAPDQQQAADATASERRTLLAGRHPALTQHTLGAPGHARPAPVGPVEAAPVRSDLVGLDPLLFQHSLRPPPRAGSSRAPAPAPAVRAASAAVRAAQQQPGKVPPLTPH